MTYKYTNGLGNVGSFQTSGVPFATSSLPVPALGTAPYELTFPQVTKFITIRNDGAATVRVGYSVNGVTGSLAGINNYFTLGQNISYEADLKVTSLFLLSDSAATSTCTVMAGLTGIPTNQVVNNWSGSLGVG
tara:strand:+ start:1265 stop:1663 length:399 start_codon:yes stop_codon:yes gene_type:complete